MLLGSFPQAWRSQLSRQMHPLLYAQFLWPLFLAETCPVQGFDDLLCRQLHSLRKGVAQLLAALREARPHNVEESLCAWPRSDRLLVKINADHR